MANISDLTRKDQVHEYLKTHPGWVDGPELANEVVGGSEGLKRLRELRKELQFYGHYDIEMRPHPDPDRDIYQYRLVAVTKVVAAAPPVQEPIPPPPGWSEAKAAKHGTHLGRAEDGTFITVYDGPVPDSEVEPPLPGQADMGVPENAGYRFESKPTTGFGQTLMCPKCKGIHRAIKEKDPVTGKPAKLGKVIGYEEKTRDPNKPSQECPRCNGWGLVPNKA